MVKAELDQQEMGFLRKLAPYFPLLEKYFHYRAIGLSQIPARRPCLVVMNHGVLPFHGFLLGGQLLLRRGIRPRGLGASFLFRLPGVRALYLKAGVVEASPKNAEGLLRQGACVLLAPGGIYEALLAAPGVKRIPWENRLGFVKVACRAGVPIVPTYCEGINEVYFNSKWLLDFRLKLLKETRFSLPLFFGLGLLPLPVPLDHYIGQPIQTKRRRGESFDAWVRRTHRKVILAMRQLRNRAMLARGRASARKFRSV